MVKNKKLVFGIALLFALVGCGQQANNNGFSTFHEEARDLLTNNETGIRFQAGELGEGGALEHSTIYTQYGVDADNNYCLRFATALKGDISSIVYERAAFGDKEANVLDVNVIYKSIMANGVATYYDGTTLSETAGEENYYWACYTICYKSEDAKTLYDEQITMTLKVDDTTIGTKTISLNQVIHVNDDKTYYYQVENMTLSSTSSKKPLGINSVYADCDYLQNANDNDNGTVSFTFESDSAKVATLYTRVNIRSTDKTFTSGFAITFNDETIESDAIVPTRFGVDMWYTFTEVEIADVNLKEGTNTFVFTIGEDAFNVDYFKLVTKANLTGYDTHSCETICDVCGLCTNIDCPFEHCDAGENKYRFEAEDAVIASSGVDGATAPTVASNFGYVDVLTSLSTNVGSTMTYTFTSDKEGYATLSASVATSTIGRVDVSDMFDISVNAETYNTKSHKSGNYTPNLYYHTEVIIGCIKLKQGENTIVFTVKDSGKNVDYISLDTNCIIDDNQLTHAHNCSTCGKCVDPDCDATSCIEKCSVVGDKYTFANTDATLFGSASVKNDTIQNLSNKIGNGMSYTFSLEKASRVSFSIELNYRTNNPYFKDSMTTTIIDANGNETTYETSAKKLATHYKADRWGYWYDLNLGCIDLPEGQTTIKFLVNANGDVASNVRNFTVTSPVSLTK